MYFQVWINAAFPPGHLVHEAKAAGEFIPGHGKMAVAKPGEKDLGLLRHRSEVTVDQPPLEGDIPPTQPDPASPCETVPGNIDHAEPTPMAVTEESKERADMQPPAIPEKKKKKAREPPHSPALSSGSKSAARSSNSAVYDKYKDGSYWKILSCVVFCTVIPIHALHDYKDETVLHGRQPQCIGRSSEDV